MAEYQKIQTLFKRDEKNIIIPSMFTLPEFEYLKDCKWEATEKIDGCLCYKTRIQMADGSVKTINKVQEGDIVIGYDTENGTGVKQVVVQKVSKQSSAGTWVRVKATHTGLGYGNSCGQIICTFDHRIWTPDRGYVEAKDLKPGDKILSIRRDIALNPIQEQILMGKMLGDGSLTVKEDSKTASVEFGHSTHTMTLWTLQGLQELAGNVHHRTSGFDSDILVGRTKNSRQIYEKFHHWIVEGGKQVPEDVFLTPISLAFWYMDDGSLEHNEGQEDRARIATNRYNAESCSYLQRELSKLGIECTIRDYKGNTICFNAENAEKLFLIVMPYICKEYQYKLPERYRDIVPYIPTIKKTQYHSELVEQSVLSVEQEPVSYERWDLTTETHNFFTTTGLVHNTNMRVELTPEFKDVETQPGTWEEEVNIKFEFKGRTDKADIPKHLLEKMQSLFDKDKLIEYFYPEDKDEIPNITLYGEGYGMKIQKGGNYIKNGVDFILFDVRVGNWWLSREACEKIASDFNLKIVPLMGYMTLQEAIDFVKKGFKSTIAENKDYDAEGLVLKTPYGLRLRNGERLITKIKTCDFQKYQKAYGNGPVEQKINPKYQK